MGLKVIVHNIKADDSALQPHLLVLENAGPFLGARPVFSLLPP